MATKQTQDPGFGTSFLKKTKRLINKDGSFNVKKHGVSNNLRDTYQWLIKVKWRTFFMLVFSVLTLMNVLFAIVYFLIGPTHFHGITSSDIGYQFRQMLYFSFQTFTTVGYGHIAPRFDLVSIIAAVESIIGLITFALITGLIYGRFSRPTARIQYSKNAIIAPYKDIKALQFRIANTRMSMLLELKATVMIQITEEVNGTYKRNFAKLPLERETIIFFPLNWTIVHPIDNDSPLFGLTESTLEKTDLEILILIQGFDDTFGQTVHSRHSYTYKEIEFDAQFVKAYKTDENGDIILNVGGLDTIQKVN